MGKNGFRYTLEEKLFYINLVQAESMTAYAIQHQYGVRHSHVTHWVELYQSGGIDALKPQTQNKSYSETFKSKIVQEYLKNDTSYAILAKKYHIPSPGSVYQWVSLYTSGKSFGSTRREKTVKDGRKTTKIERIEIAEWTIAKNKQYAAAMKHFNVSYGQVYSWVRKYEQHGPEALADRRGKNKEQKGELTENEKKDLEIKRLRARLEYVSSEAAILKKLQEIERKDARQKNIRQFKHLPKK